MRAGTILLLPMFLLIFGPKSSGWVDVVSLTSLGLVVVHLLTLNTGHIPERAFHRMFAVFVVFLGLFLFATLHFLSKTDADSYQVLRFGRVTLNFLGVASLVSFYYRAFGDRAGQTLVRHLFHCLVMHAFVMTCMFYSDSFRHLIVNQVVQADPDSRTYVAKATGYRIAGLTDSWDALSGLQSLGLLMLPILLTRQHGWSYFYVVFSIPLLLFSVAISGRTGFVTLACLLPVALAFTDLRRVHRTTGVGLVVVGLGALLVLGPLRNSCLRAIEDSSLGRTVAMFGLDYTRETHRRESMSETFAGIVEDHYFLPDSWQVLLWGSGGSGRDSWDYVPADNGPVLNLHNLGLFAFTTIYGLIAWTICSSVSGSRRLPIQSGVTMLAIALIALIDFKVMYVFSRNGFSVMLIPLLAFWWDDSSFFASSTESPSAPFELACLHPQYNVSPNRGPQLPIWDAPARTQRHGSNSSAHDRFLQRYGAHENQ